MDERPDPRGAGLAARTLWGPEVGGAVLLRELAEDEEVRLLVGGSAGASGPGSAVPPSGQRLTLIRALVFSLPSFLSPVSGSWFRSNSVLFPRHHTAPIYYLSPQPPPHLPPPTPTPL